METVMRRKESEVQLIFKNLRISIMGQCPERAYDERNVYIQISGGCIITPITVWANAEEILQMANQLIIQSSGIITDSGDYDYDLSDIQFEYSGIITTGGDTPDNDRQHAITITYDNYIGTYSMTHQNILTLATALISQSEFALTANMRFNALIHEKRRFKKLRQKYDVKEIIIKCVDPEPYNYGPGFKEFNISLSYDMTDGYIPKYPHDRNFSYNEVIYFSKLENDFEKDILSITGGSIPYRFVNYDYDEEVRLFNADIINYDTNATYTACGDVSNAPIPDKNVNMLMNSASAIKFGNHDSSSIPLKSHINPWSVAPSGIRHTENTICDSISTDPTISLSDIALDNIISSIENTPIDLSSTSIDSSIDSPIAIVENMISLFNRINSGDSDI